MTSSFGSRPALLEPQRVLQPEGRAPDGVGVGQAVADRRRQQRPGARQLLVREGDPESAPVVLLDLGVGVGERRVVAVAGDVHRPDIHAGIAVIAGGHPGRERQADAAALRQPGHDPAGDPVAAQPADRPDQRIAVGRERERPVDDALDADRAHRRVVLERDRQLGRDAVEVRLRAAATRSPTASRAATTARTPARTCPGASRRLPGGCRSRRRSRAPSASRGRSSRPARRPRACPRSAGTCAPWPGPAARCRPSGRPRAPTARRR